jgi:hypothetical protein
MNNSSFLMVLRSIEQIVYKQSIRTISLGLLSIGYNQDIQIQVNHCFNGYSILEKIIKRSTIF